MSRRSGGANVDSFSETDATRFCDLVREGITRNDRILGVTNRNYQDLEKVLKNVYHFLVGTCANAQQMASMYGTDVSGNPTGKCPEYGLGVFWENCMERLRFKNDLFAVDDSSIRFANSDSYNFYQHRGAALKLLRRQLEYMQAVRSNAPAPAPAPLPSLSRLALKHKPHKPHDDHRNQHSRRNQAPPPTSGLAALYVVASGGQGPDGNGSPMLLLLKHRHGNYYGVPTGFQKPGERLITTALRGFVEDFLGKDSGQEDVEIQKQIAKHILSSTGGELSLLQTSPDDTMAAYLLVVPHTFFFETLANMYGISRKMDGYAWFTLSDIQNEIKNPTQINRHGGLLVPDRSGVWVPTGAYTIGRPTRNGGWKPMQSILKILEMFPS